MLDEQDGDTELVAHAVDGVHQLLGLVGVHTGGGLVQQQQLRVRGQCAGRAIKAIRDNEIAARSVGIPITKYKLMAFVTSAVFAGVAGVLYALNYSSLVAKKFDYNTSILILVFVVLGGIGNLRGSVIAAAVLTVLPELLRSMNDYRMLIYAIVLIVVMIFNQSPEMIALRKRLTARFRKEDAEGKGAKDKEKKGVA